MKIEASEVFDEITEQETVHVEDDMSDRYFRGHLEVGSPEI